MIRDVVRPVISDVVRGIYGGDFPFDLDLIAWYDLQDPTLMTVERNGTGGEPGDGDVVGRITDKSGNGVYWTAVSDAARPILRLDASGYYLDFDDVDDSMSWTITDSGQIGMATRNGTYVADCTYSGAFALPVYQPFDYTDVIIADSISASDFEAYAVARGAAGSFGAVSSFVQAWRGRSDFTSFPVIDLGSATSLTQTWKDCSNIVTFPLIDTSLIESYNQTWMDNSSIVTFPALDMSAGNDFNAAWRNNTSLVNFPANRFDSVTATDFTNAFASTNLSEASIDAILVSINVANTSSGTFKQSLGTAPSATGEAAIDALRARSWTVTVTGGY
jgi:hypothetical protein